MTFQNQLDETKQDSNNTILCSSPLGVNSWSCYAMRGHLTMNRHQKLMHRKLTLVSSGWSSRLAWTTSEDGALWQEYGAKKHLLLALRLKDLRICNEITHLKRIWWLPCLLLFYSVFIFFFKSMFLTRILKHILVFLYLKVYLKKKKHINK